MRHFIVFTLAIAFSFGALADDAAELVEMEALSVEAQADDIPVGDYSGDYDCSELSEYTGKDECASLDMGGE